MQPCPDRCDEASARSGRLWSPRSWDYPERWSWPLRGRTRRRWQCAAIQEASCWFAKAWAKVLLLKPSTATKSWAALRLPSGIVDRHGLPGPVDKHLFTGQMHLPQNRIERARPRLVELAKPAIAVALLWMGLPVFFPEQLEGHAFATEFLVDVEPVRQRLGWRGSFQAAAKQLAWLAPPR